MKVSILLAAAIATTSLAVVLPAAPADALSIGGPAVSAAAASAQPGSPALPSMLLGLLGLVGLILAGNRPGAGRPTPRAALLAALALLLPSGAGAAPILSEVFFNPAGPDDGLEWIEIYNDGAAPVDLSGYSLGFGGADYTTGTVQLAGVVMPGQYFVVGGPTSDAANFFPAFDQPVNFAPDLENSGWFQAADGVALFGGPATSITAASVPVDAFIYAGAIASSNSSGLPDENGSPGAVDYVQPLFGWGYSAEFDGGSWSQQSAPTPNAGPLALPEPGTGLLLALGLACAARRPRARSPRGSAKACRSAG